MSRVENQLELFRGQIEELQGKMLQGLSRLAGARSAIDVIRGRGLEMRGKARQVIARSRLGAEDISESIQKHPEMYAPYAALLALGVVIASLAIFSPQTLVRAWDLIRRPVTQVAGAAVQAQAGPTP